MEIKKLLKQMRKADKLRVETEKADKSILTDKQKYLRSLRGFK